MPVLQLRLALEPLQSTYPELRTGNEHRSNVFRPSSDARSPSITERPSARATKVEDVVYFFLSHISQAVSPWPVPPSLPFLAPLERQRTFLLLNPTVYSHKVPRPSQLNAAPEPPACSVKVLRFAPMDANPAALAARTDSRLHPPRRAFASFFKRKSRWTNFGRPALMKIVGLRLRCSDGDR